MRPSNTKCSKRLLVQLSLHGVIAATAMLALQALPVHAQSGPGTGGGQGGQQGGQQVGQAALAPTIPTVTCPNEGLPLLKIPELVTSGRVLRGTIKLIDEQQRISTSAGGGAKPCVPQYVRNFRGEGALPPSHDAPPPSQPPYADPVPGPTLRARVGDVVQLTLLNEVNSNHFDLNIDREACTQVSPSPAVGSGGAFAGYPCATRDAYPNCLHATSTANLHFHGTHTSPISSADNIFLQVRPLPRTNAGALAVTPAQITVGLDAFFAKCKDQLRNPLNQWPKVWSDLPGSWTTMQKKLLTAYDSGTAPYNPPGQPDGSKLWPPNQSQIDKKGWPQYYVGAFPYCFALPEYKEAGWSWPPKPGVLNMGQSPGTHWYHAHKHGATAINVANGMVGAFVIEGKYDDEIEAAYKTYTLKDGQTWKTRNQPVIVLNQIWVVPNLMAGTTNVDFTVNGRLRPVIKMQPGEVQLWRIVNGSGRSAAYFMPPPGGTQAPLEWYQLAQDGVQFTDANYKSSRDVPFYMASGNRVDLLVRAPQLPTGTTSLTRDVNIQNVMARNKVNAPAAITKLFTVNVSGPPVTQAGKPAVMPFLTKAPTQPPFLVDITDRELMSPRPSVTLEFDSSSAAGNNKGPYKHTINGKQFSGTVDITVPMNNAQEWLIKNKTGLHPGPIDHPFHIHVNPFQITEFFDPNQKLLAQDGTPGTTPKYVLAPTQPTADQCQLDPANPATWKPCKPQKLDGVWWDTFAIPSGRPIDPSDPNSKIIPGYFKMRSRFVDYFGTYVLHCHILVHEDRGMMFEVEVVANNKPMPHMTHH